MSKDHVSVSSLRKSTRTSSKATPHYIDKSFSSDSDDDTRTRRPRRSNADTSQYDRVTSTPIGQPSRPVRKRRSKETEKEIVECSQPTPAKLKRMDSEKENSTPDKQSKTPLKIGQRNTGKGVVKSAVKTLVIVSPDSSFNETNTSSRKSTRHSKKTAASVSLPTSEKSSSGRGRGRPTRNKLLDTSSADSSAVERKRRSANAKFDVSSSSNSVNGDKSVDESTRRTTRKHVPNKRYYSQRILSAKGIKIKLTRTPEPKSTPSKRRGRPAVSASVELKTPAKSPMPTGSKSIGSKTTKLSASKGDIPSTPSNSGRPGRSRKATSVSLNVSKDEKQEDESDVSEDCEDDQAYDSGTATTKSENSSDSSDDETPSEDDSDPEFEISGVGNRKNIKNEYSEEVGLESLNPKMLKRRSKNKCSKSLRPQEREPTSIIEEGSSTMECYFLASNRQKFRSEKQQPAGMNDTKKGKRGTTKKPRKGTRGLGGQSRVNLLPEKTKSNFSVTKEGSRVASTLPILPSGGIKHVEEIDELLQKSIIPDFPRWLLLMTEGFNVMLHGFGSKAPVFQAFKTYLNDRWLTITVNGLYPKLNPRQFLVELCDALDIEDRIRVQGTNMEVVAEQVYEELRDLTHPSVFLLIRNFDSLAINHPALLTVLCSLARVKWIHILASSDTVNAFLGVNQNQTIQLNFCWISCSTFQPYEEELTWVPGAFGEQENSGAAKSTLQYVLKSLTGNARKAFGILATLQLAKLQEFSKGKNSKDFIGVEFRELARRCRESFIAHSDTALNTLLVEFIDHKLVTQHGKKKNVGNLLTVDLDTDLLEKLVKGEL